MRVRVKLRERVGGLLAAVGQRVSHGCILICGHLSWDCGALQCIENNLVYSHHS